MAFDIETRPESRRRHPNAERGLADFHGVCDDQQSMADDPPVKEVAEARECLECGGLTWSASGLCFKCRRKERPQPISRPSIVRSAYRSPLLDERGRLAENILCRRCGYNLRGAALDGVCPECEWPVERSVRGDALRFSDPKWVAKLARGSLLIALGGLLVIPIMVATTLFLPPLSAETSRFVVVMVSAAIVVYGVWLLTEPEPAHEHRAFFTARHVARYSVFSCVVAFPMGTYTGNIFSGIGLLLPAVWLFSWLLVIVSVAAIFRLLAQLAGRIPRRWLATNANIVCFGGTPAVLLIWTRLFAEFLGTGAGVEAMFVCIRFMGTAVFSIWGVVVLCVHTEAFAAVAREACLYDQSAKATGERAESS